MAWRGGPTILRWAAKGMPTAPLKLGTMTDTSLPDGTRLPDTRSPDTRLIVQRLTPAAQMPRKAHPGDACFDLFAARAAEVLPGQRTALCTGLAMQIEEGWEVQVRGRSGLAARGVQVHFGTVDFLYRLEVKVLVTNAGSEPWLVAVGDRIAQVQLARVPHVELLEGVVEGSERGGFGSSGR